MTNDRLINAELWEPLPGMVKLRCDACRYFFASYDPLAEHCPDCAIRMRPRRPHVPAKTSAPVQSMRYVRT